MPDDAKDPKQEENENTQNGDGSESQEGDTDRLSSMVVNSDTEDESDPKRVVNFDPFYCDVDKRTALISRVGTMMANERKRFMMAPIPPGVWFECYVDRIRLGFSRFSRKFSLHVDSGSHAFLAMCMKRKRNRTANYLISTDPNIASDTGREADFTVGKLRSNFIGSEFMAYDTGLNPKRLKDLRSSHDPDLRPKTREELMSLQYEHALFGKSIHGPRRIQVVLPHIKQSDDGLQRVSCKPLAPQVDGLAALANHWAQSTVATGKQPIVRTYTTKPAVWSSRKKCYVLNFNHRVRGASVKNFQLVPSDDTNEIVLQFGRSEDRNKFHLDFRYPLSPFQAFSIAITAMDYKICSE